MPGNYWNRPIRCFSAAGQIPQQVMVASEILRCYFNEWKSFREIEPWIERLENLLEEHGSQLPEPMQANAYCGLLLALMFSATAPARAESVRGSPVSADGRMNWNLILKFDGDLPARLFRVARAVSCLRGRVGACAAAAGLA